MPSTRLARFASRHAGALLLALGAGSMLAAPAALAIGSLAEVTLIDRASGQVLPVYAHQGRYWVEGRPGSRYAVRVHNKSGERVLSVIAVDGVNVISGETAGTGQAGYVFSPWERYDVAGWRKSNAQVAAFFFTALENSYAARTGRPNDVGVIGVALFREKPPAVSNIAPRPLPYRRSDGAAADMRERAEGPVASAAEPGAAAKSGSAAGAQGENRAAAAPPAPAQPRLGTGHGEREYSRVETTTFQRAAETPDDVVTIHYDSRENLVAMGVIAAPQPLPRPRPFPGQPGIGYVPDPPGRW